MVDKMIIDHRKSKRLKVNNGIVITPGGLCQIINLSPKGLSFKCFKRMCFLRKWSLDIYNTSGMSLEQLKVKKIWEEYSSVEAPSPGSVIVGVEFNKLSPPQKKQIKSYILRMKGFVSNI